MKRYLPFIIIFVVAAGAITSGALIYQAKRAELVTMTTAAAKAGPGAPGAKTPHVRGGAKAPVTIEEFGDFQCPPCEMLAPIMTKLEHDYGEKLRVVFRHYPLRNHPHAPLAARTAEAAGLQGKFWEMHDLLYRKRSVWAAPGANVPELFLEYARSLGLDAERLKQDVESEPVKERVRADQERGNSKGVNSTPTLFINDHLLPFSSLNETALRAAIDNTLSGKPPVSPPPSATPSPNPVMTLKP